MTFCLLCTCAGGELAPYFVSLARASKRHDVRVIGVDAVATSCRTADAFYRVPFGNSPEYLDAVIDVVRNERVDLVLPTSDEEAIALARGRERIEAAGARLACTDYETIALFSNKAATYQRLTAAGFHMPRWHECRSREDIVSAVKDLVAAQGVCIVKPAVARGGRGVRTIRAEGGALDERGRHQHLTLDDFLQSHLGDTVEQAPVLVMEQLEPPVFDIDMLAWEGRAIRVVARKRVDPILPNEGHMIVQDERLEAIGHRLIQEFALSWLYDCDVMVDRDGRPCILEINPRPSGSVSAPVTAGVPLIDDLISLVKGEAIPNIAIPYGRVVVPIKALALAGTATGSA